MRKKCSVCVSKMSVTKLLISLKTMRTTVSIELCPDHIAELLRLVNRRVGRIPAWSSRRPT